MTHARVLASHLADLLSRERIAMADFLVALAAFDRNRSWAELGHSSLFDFLHRELGLSKGAAHYRKTAAQLVQKFPEIVDAFRDGRLCITSVVHLAKVLTAENRHEMLPKFFQRSRQESMALAAAIQPAAAGPHRDVVTCARPGGGGVVGAAYTATSAAASAAVQPGELAAVQPGEPLQGAQRSSGTPRLRRRLDESVHGQRHTRWRFIDWLNSFRWRDRDVDDRPSAQHLARHGAADGRGAE